MDIPIKLHTADELLLLPEPKWMIQDIVHQQSTAALWGPPNWGKSFIALDWALCVSAGVPWLGRYDTIQAPVVYMAGEGAASLQKRIGAWQEAYQVDDMGAAYFQVRSLPLREEETVDAIIDSLDSYSDGVDVGLNPGFIIVDTVSQFFGGGDENGPDMAQFVYNVRRLSQEQNLTVLLVHHSNATGLRERGHTALRGNVDAMFEVRPRDIRSLLSGITLLTDKQRDSAKGEGIVLQFEEFADSLVPRWDETQNVGALPSVTRQQMRMLAVFDQIESKKSESFQHDLAIDTLGLSKATFHRKLIGLKVIGLVSNAGRGKSALTHIGRAVLAQEEK